MVRTADAVPLEQVHRALVINLRHIGDVLLSTPIPQVIKNHAPHCEVDVLVYGESAAMVEEHPAVSRIHAIDRRWKSLGPIARILAELKLYRAMKERGYDLVVALTPHRRSQWLTKALKPRWAVAPSYPAAGKGWKRTFSHVVPRPIATWRHTVEIYLDALRRIGCMPLIQERGLVLVPGGNAEKSVASMLDGLALRGKEFVVIHPGSRWTFKCWPAASMASLVDQLGEAGWKVVLTAGPDPAEMEMAAQIQVLCKTPVADLAGRLSLKELAALVAKARLFVGVDSAPMHIAAAMNTPALVIFGPSGSREWGPWSANAVVATNSDYQCVPCGRAGCADSKVSECLETLAVAKVADLAMKMLAGDVPAGGIPSPWIAHLATPGHAQSA